MDHLTDDAVAVDTTPADDYNDALASAFDDESEPDTLSPGAAPVVADAPTTGDVNAAAADADAADADAADADAADADAADADAADAADDAAAITPEPAPAPAPVPVQHALTAEDIARAVREGNAPAPAPEPAPQVPTAPTIEDFISPEDREVLARYDAEWGEVSEAERIRTNATVAMAMAIAKQEWARALAPIADVVSQSQTRTFRESVLAVHPDVDTVVPHLDAWVGTQPALVQPAYRAAMASGTIEQVNQLLSAYKAATVGAPGAEPQPTASTPAPRVTQQREARAAAAKATAAVTRSQRGELPRGVDHNDFNSAFDEALNIA